MTKLVWAGLAALALAAALASPFAASEPDGLQRVAAEEGFAATERDHALDDGPLAGYEVDGIEDPTASRSVATLLGVVVVFAAATGAFRLLARRRRGDRL